MVRNSLWRTISGMIAVCILVVNVSGCAKEVVTPKLPTAEVEQPVVSSQVVSKPEPVSESVPESIPEEKAPPEFSFSEEELTRLNTMLDEWTKVIEPAASMEEGKEGEYGNNVAVFFRDIESGLTYSYNGDKLFLVASLNKAPYAMYLYHLVETGQASLDETFHVTEEMVEDMKENSGKLIEMDDLPKDFTLEEMIILLLHYSDTAALRILLAKYGAVGYKEYMESVGVPTENIRNVTNGRITANEGGAYMNALYTFMETSAYGPSLKEKLSNTNYHMIRTENQYVGKYGWDKQAYHDMGIIYAQHPYELIILTDKDVGSWTEYKMFSKIAYTFEEMMNAKWAEYDAL